MLQGLRATLRKTPLRPIYRAARKALKGRGHSQSDEQEILKRLVASERPPLTFVEFGFSPTEFNCIGLVDRVKGGLLIDTSAESIRFATEEFPKTIKAVNRFLTLDNLDIVRTSFDKIGILSIDVDGNDYWFMEALIHTAPTILAVEYNASFGLRSITVPYDPAFDRLKKHPTGWHHGASITALSKLAAKHGYGLAAVSKSGVNLFFTRNGKLDPEKSWRPNALRDKWSKTTTAEQWETIKHMPCVEI